MPALTSRRRASTMVIIVTSALAIATAPALGATTHHKTRRRSHDGALCANANTPAALAPLAAIKASVVCLINHQRAIHGLPTLREDSRLDRSAQGWTDRMVATGRFAHGTDFAARISAVGYAWSSAGENIATGFATPQQVVSAWMRSPGHCTNILDPDYRSVGTGVVDRPMIYPFSTDAATWTQDFALPMGASAPSNNWGPATSAC